MKRICQHCKYFQAPQAPGANPECHRYPPKTTAFMKATPAFQQPAFHFHVQFDITMPNWTCGEYQVRLEAAHTLDNVQPISPVHQ